MSQHLWMQCISPTTHCIKQVRVYEVLKHFTDIFQNFAGLKKISHSPTFLEFQIFQVRGNRDTNSLNL